MSDAFTFEQDQFEAEFNKTKDEAAKADLRFKRFVSIAYVLKAVAIFGGIAITAGLPERVAQGVGVLISIAIGLDALLSHQKRLMSSAMARISYRGLLETVMFKHTSALSRLLPTMKTDEKSFLASMAGELTKLRTELFQGRREVVEAVEKAELMALEALKLDTKES